MADTALALTRRRLLQRAAVGGIAFTCGGWIEACGGSRVRATSVARFEPSPGVEIPRVDVRFAMWPFGDTTIGFIGIEQGFFRDVGIDLSPGGGETQLVDQTPGELLSGQLDLASGYMPIQIQTFPRQPQIKMVQLHDIYVGNYLLASPDVAAKTYEQFSAAGASFQRAAKSAIRQISGRRVALGTAGNNRDFFSTLLGIAGLTPQDFKLTVIDDAKILELARAGDIDFAMPSGAAQNVVLLNEGFVRVFGIKQLLANLPPGDPRAVTALGDAGIVGTEDYLKANIETLLRFMSVYYRIIDQVQREPDTALAIVLPHLTAATGLSLTLRDCKLIFSRFYRFISFEQTAGRLFNKRDPLQLDNVYVPQIQAARRGGIYSANEHATPEDIFVGARFYRILRDLRRRYAEVTATGSPTGRLAAMAEAHYKNRNYLDAYRLIKAA
jgi:ABC-type nitrate/sulfonate/bicarbonate transport system substrate-binding protein